MSERAHQLKSPAPAAIAEAAWQAMQSKDYASALVHWNQLLDGSDPNVALAWRRGKALTLNALRRFDEAAGVARELLIADPGDLAAADCLASAQYASLLEQDETAEGARAALEELRSGIFAGCAPAFRCVWSARYSLLLHQIIEAQGFIDTALRERPLVRELEICSNLVPQIFDHSQRPFVWRRMLARLDTLENIERPDEGLQARVLLRLRLLLALRDYAKFRSVYDDAARRNSLPQGYRTMLRACRERLDLPQMQLFGEEKLFGVGLSRTSATSLAEAAEILGFHVAQWNHPLTEELLSDEHFLAFSACFDIPSADQFERLYFTYPKARFVYTVRPLQSWLDSVSRHYRRYHQFSDPPALRQHFAEGCPLGRENLALHLSLYFNHATFSEAYAAHDRRVRSFFAANDRSRLLIFNAFEGDGWDELCHFLGRPVPKAPFPWTNKF